MKLENIITFWLGADEYNVADMIKTSNMEVETILEQLEAFEDIDATKEKDLLQTACTQDILDGFDLDGFVDFLNLFEQTQCNIARFWDSEYYNKDVLKLIDKEEK